ncbi:MAG: histidine--tRNA ligase [Candidatus Hydrogenedentes bacterium]|nr:histidine--tRNA ligase [Candidatus Hydrogenedentota bacterium]
MDSLVEPRILKGFQDLLPEEYIPRKHVIAKIEAIFQKYGFVPIETPAIEHLDVLLGTGGEETNKELFRLETPEAEPVALRFDLTVPFARILAQYPDRVKTPFRRYAMGPVWRADKPGPGRFRQFTQFDIDAAGSDSVSVDAEIIAIMCEVMETLGVTGFRAVVNNRKVIDALLVGCGISDCDRQKHVLRVIDKLAKVGIDNVRLELGPGRVDDSGDPIPGVGLDSQTIERVVSFVGLGGGTRHEVVERLASTLPNDEISNAAVSDMRALADALAALGVPEQSAHFEPSLARGLDYYTGPVFEMTIPSAPQFGSVMGGGRYDGLVSRFMDRPVPSTGMAVGLDRLVAALAHLGLISPERTTVEVLVVSLGGVPEAETLKLAAELRAAGLRTEPYFGSKKGMKNQLSHADHYGIPVAVIVGGDELAQGVVSVKDLFAGKQQREGIEDREAYRQAGRSGQVTVSRAEMVAAVRDVLASHTS